MEFLEDDELRDLENPRRRRRRVFRPRINMEWLMPNDFSVMVHDKRLQSVNLTTAFKMTVCSMLNGDEEEKYTCPTQPWDRENIFCCGMNIAKICCAEEEYYKMADHSQEFAKWELLGHVASLILLVIIGITCCVSCYCCHCCPAFRHREQRGRVIRTPDTVAGFQMRPMATATPAAPPPQQYPTAGYATGYQVHPPPQPVAPFPQPTAPPFGPVAVQPAGRYAHDPPPPYPGSVP